MRAEISSFRAPSIRAIVVALLVASGGVLVAQAPSGWKTLSLGFSAEVLLNRNSAMWAAGSAETIAVSTDGGQHWVKKHENPSGALLLSFRFVTANFGFAAGTGGVVVFTQDGGETWTAKKMAAETILQAAFGDPVHGVIRTRTALLATTDGGTVWKPIVPSNYADWNQKSPYTESVTALDAKHLLVRVSEGEFRDGVFLWTADGGATWTANYLPDGAGSGEVFVDDGEYWSIGHQVVGGGAIPMAVRSRDGISWDHEAVYREACHWHGCGGCTSQGCFAGQKSFVPFSRILEGSAQGLAKEDHDPNAGSGKAAAESLDQFPAHLLSDQWAMSGNTLCILTHGSIDCTSLTPVAVLDTKDEAFDFDSQGWPPIVPTRSDALSVSVESVLGHGVRCIRCMLERSYISEKGPSGQAPFGLSFTIGVSGRAEKVNVTGPVASDVADKIRKTANSWLFEPYAENGVTKAIPVNFSGKILVMNFAKPPGQQ